MNDLEFMAFSWLRFEKKCSVALTGRSPRGHHGLPDVLGITSARYLFEIEIKRSISDFRANERKPFIAHRNSMFKLEGEVSHPMYPKMFWYLVPHELVEKVKPMLPPWAGLLRGPKEDEIQSLWSVVKAPQNKSSKRLTPLECGRLAHCMSNQIFSMAERLHAVRRQDYWNEQFYKQDYSI